MLSEKARIGLKVFFYTTVFCIGIGITIWATDPEADLLSSLIVSFCIGWSINLSFYVLDDVIQRHLSPYIAPILPTAIGLGAGLLLAGTLVTGNPWFFYTENYFTLVTGVFFGIVGFLLFGTHSRLLQAQAELATANAEHAQREKLLTETELKLLQAQIEPHFLFNTLSNIASLIHEEPATAEKTLLNLTTLLRATLDRTRSETTTLAQELQIASAYLEIQATRMRGRLTYEVINHTDSATTKLPPLIVQPLIENAVKHGIEPSETGGHIKVEVDTVGDHLEIQVHDNGLGFPGADQNKPASTGLPNVRERLSALFEDASLKLTEPESGGVCATLRIPLES